MLMFICLYAYMCSIGNAVTGRLVMTFARQCFTGISRVCTGKAFDAFINRATAPKTFNTLAASNMVDTLGEASPRNFLGSRHVESLFFDRCGDSLCVVPVPAIVRELFKYLPALSEIAHPADGFTRRASMRGNYQFRKIIIQASRKVGNRMRLYGHMPI